MKFIITLLFSIIFFVGNSQNYIVDNYTKGKHTSSEKVKPVKDSIPFITHTKPEIEYTVETKTFYFTVGYLTMYTKPSWALTTNRPTTKVYLVYTYVSNDESKPYKMPIKTHLTFSVKEREKEYLLQQKTAKYKGDVIEIKEFSENDFTEINIHNLFYKFKNK